MTPVLEVRGVTVRNGGRVAVDDVSFTIAAGEVVGLLGLNGAGKTTLMETVVGRRRSEAGVVLLQGHLQGPRVRGLRRQVGYAAQEPAVYPTLTVLDNLRFWEALTTGGAGRGAGGRADVDRAIEGMHLGALRHRVVQSLSGGERRRVHCAMATVGRPALLLLDEPTVGVDPLTRQAILDHILSLAGEGTAICYSTHYMPEIEALCARVLMLHEGRVVAQGPVEQLVRRYGRQVVTAEVQPPEAGAARRRTVVPSDDPATDVPVLLADLARRGETLVDLRIGQPSLDDVFRQVVAESRSEVARVP